MSENVNARNSASKSICRIASWSKNIESDTTAALIEAKLTLLNDMWRRYSDCHDAVLGVCGKDTIESENAQYLPVEDIYVESLARLTHALNTIEINNTSSSSRSSMVNPPAVNPQVTIQAPQVSPLPKISLPKFSDGYVEWQAYKDLFGVLVHNNPELKNIEKFHYLRSSLSGEAERIINHIALTDANYNNAWTTLENRYSNTRIVSSILVNQLMQQQVASENSGDIKHLLDTTNQTLEMLKNLNRPIEQWDDLIIHIISEKLPHQSRQLWEASLADTSVPATWTQLQTFIRTRFRTLEASSGSQQPSTRSTGASSKSVSVKNHSLHITTQFNCNFCGEPHPIHRCQKYLAETVAVRRQFVRDHHLCYNCLRTNHSASQCQSTARCNQCKKLHHTSLHEATSSGNFTTTTLNNVKSSTTSDDNTHEFTNTIASSLTPTALSNSAAKIIANNVNNNTFVHQTVLLATAKVKATSHTGTTTPMRALIDQGSQISLITEHATQMLGLKRQHSNLDIVPVGHGPTISPNGVTTLKLSSNYNNNEIFANLYILPNITTVLPTKKVKVECIFELPAPLADPQWNTPMPVEILLGADTYHKLIQPGIRKLNNNTILAQNTIFGWILSGELHNQSSENSTITTCSQITVIDNSETNEPSANTKENFIEQHFGTTHSGTTISRLRQIERTIESRIKLQRELKHPMKAGCMELLKWTAISDEILSTIPEQERQCNFPPALNMNETISTLGIGYEPVNDTFIGFNIENESSQLDKITKRQLLSNAGKLFNPIDWLEPVKITLKIMMQNRWLLKLDWDDPIPENLKREWQLYRKGLNQLSRLKIDRWTVITRIRTYQLHGSSDASTLTYAAVVYLRVHNNENNGSSISINAARSRVSPIKTASIPLLELSGAALVAKLIHHIINNALPKIDREMFAWCDSEITLKWLKSTPSRWKVIICNRTSEILSKLPTCKFGYIKSSSTLTQLLRVTSYIRRIMNYKKVPLHVKSAEASTSMSSLIIYTQRTHFADIVKTSNAPIHKQSKGILAPLSPFIDSKRTLQMGGRLSRSTLSYEQRHPIILPRKAHLTKLITHHTHHQTSHGEVLLLVNKPKANYRIIHARSAVNEIIHKMHQSSDL